jgi:hypothetical protein
MNKSDYLVGFLDSKTQAAWKAKASEEPTTDDKPKVPATPEVALLRRIRKVVFGPSVKDLATALDRFNAIVDSLDDSEEDDNDGKPSDKDKV